MIKRLLFWCVAALACIVAVAGCINIAMVWGEQRYMYAAADELPVRAVVIIPGAAVLRSGALSAVFLDRVTVAIEVYRAGRASKILVSGDNGTDEHNEVDPVRRYLLAEGIPEGDIYLDHAGFDTYSTMYRARDIFGIDSAIIATQSFHLPRALFIARTLGIDAVGIRSDRVHLLARNYVRESLARVKAVMDLVVRRSPKFLGEKIPII